MDNPLIFCSSNKSIRAHLEVKFKSKCKICYRKDLSFSHNLADCEYKPEMLTAISTCKARIIEVKITKPLFELIDALQEELSKDCQIEL